jgi:hypothetical protein
VNRETDKSHKKELTTQIYLKRFKVSILYYSKIQKKEKQNLKGKEKSTRHHGGRPH